MTSAAAPSRPRFRLNGWHVLAGFVLFFGADIAVNTVFIVRAYRTFPGEVSVTPYEDGLLYDAALRQKAAQDALGWRLTARAESRDHVTVTAEDAKGAPIGGLKLAGLLQRPATEDDKRNITFAEIAPGRYRAAAGDLAGAWDLDVTASDGAGHKFIAERRLVQP
jgi:nitrogen fixation protein FixH